MPILIVMLLASFILAIFEAIIEFITGVITAIIDGIYSFLAKPITTIIKGLFQLDNFVRKTYDKPFNPGSLEVDRDEQLVMINGVAFEELKKQIEQSSISREVVGLDDVMLKKMLLAYNMGNYSYKTDIIIELTPEEKEACEDDPSLYSPFELKQGKELKQLDYSTLQGYVDQITGWIGGQKEQAKAEITEKKEMSNAYYLHANGILELYVNIEKVDKNGNVTYKPEELIYYGEGILNQLYQNDYLKQSQTLGHENYSESVWEYLNKCYTDGVNGIKMYSYENVSESLKEWRFDDALSLDPDITRTLFTTNYKTRTAQNIELYNLVSEYTTPVEFMVDLLEISSSKEFVNAFIDKVAEQTRIKIMLYKTGQSYIEEEKEENKEITKVKGEFVCKAEFVKMTWEEEETRTVDGKEEKVTVTKEINDFEDAGIKIRCSTEDLTADFFGYELFDYGLERIIKISNIPKRENVKITLKIFDTNSKSYKNVTIKADGKDTVEWNDSDWFVEKYEYKDNGCTTFNNITTVTTATKYEAAVDKVETWYGDIEYNNIIQTGINYESIDDKGKLVSVKDENSIIMNSYEKEDEKVNKKSPEADKIFDTSKTTTYLTIEELNKRIKLGLAELSSGNPIYWLSLGPITREWLDWINKGGIVSTEGDLWNVKLIFNLENGVISEAWFKDNYTPVEITSEYGKCEKGKLITSIDSQLEVASKKVEYKYENFLSLFKNDNGGKYDKDAQYGVGAGYEEVYYEDVYGDDERVAKLFLNAEDMFYQLLEKSPNTAGLQSIMIEIMNKYKGEEALEGDTIVFENLRDDFTIIGEDFDEKLWISLIRLGLTEEQAASVMGNVAVDCGFNETTVVSTNKEEIGLAKWSKARRIALISYAKTKGITGNKIDVNTQIQFLIGELTEGGRGNIKYQLENVSYDGETYTVTGWKKGTDVKAMAETFAYIFKKPDTVLTDISTRQSKAVEYYNKFKNHGITEVLNNVNDDQRAIVATAKSYLTAESGMCLRWVKQVYQKVVGGYAATDCALCSGYLYGVSKDFSIVPLGAAVYGQSKTSPQYGHVGIYIGDGLVMHNEGGRIKTDSLSDWTKKYPNGCWGWVSSIPVNDAYPITKELIHKGTHP